MVFDEQKIDEIKETQEEIVMVPQKDALIKKVSAAKDEVLVLQFEENKGEEL